MSNNLFTGNVPSNQTYTNRGTGLFETSLHSSKTSTSVASGVGLCGLSSNPPLQKKPLQASNKVTNIFGPPLQSVFSQAKAPANQAACNIFNPPPVLPDQRRLDNELKLSEQKYRKYQERIRFLQQSGRQKIEINQRLLGQKGVYLAKISDLQGEVKLGKQDCKILLEQKQALQIQNEDLRTTLKIEKEEKNNLKEKLYICMNRENQPKRQNLFQKIKQFILLQDQVNEIIPELTLIAQSIIREYEQNMLNQCFQHIQRLSMQILLKIQENQKEKGKQLQLYQQTKRSVLEVMIAKQKEFKETNLKFADQLQLNVLKPLDDQIQLKRTKIDKIGLLKEKVEAFTQQNKNKLEVRQGKRQQNQQDWLMGDE